MIEAAGVEPSSIVHVGDSVEHDVAGAQAAGLRAIWLNRRGLPRPAGPVPDGEISSLADLPAAIEKLLSA